MVLSLFSGIGGFDLGLERAGMEVIGQVEIDPYCRRQLERHWPHVVRYEDVRSVGGQRCGDRARAGERTSTGGDDARGMFQPSNKRGSRSRGIRRAADHLEGQSHDAQASVSNAEWRVGDVDLICGGFPCQDLSVAGKRAGLDGDRSGLWFEFHRIVSELRPKYVLVENVPGLLSSNGGRDFAVVVNGLGDLGYAVSWAVLDSQHFGVAQRRRRVFIVAGPDPESTEAILAIAEGCGGHPETRRTSGQDIAATVRSRSANTGVNTPGRGGEDDSNLIVANTLGGGSAESSRGFRDDLDTSTYIPAVSPALEAHWAKHGNAEGGHSPLIANTIDANIGAKQWLGDQNVEDFLPVMDAITAIRTAQTSANGHGIAEDVAHTVDGANGQAVAHTLSADGFDASEDGTGRGTPLVSGASVRRLTPVECARLQGFPDDWLDGADGPQYRALGNAVSVPVIEYIGRRIMEVEHVV